MFVAAGFSTEDLVRLSQVQFHQQELFLPCMLGASGKTLDPKYTTQRKEEEHWSTLVFPKEKPPQRDFALWKLALCRVIPTGGITDFLGRLTQGRHTTWEWRWGQQQSQLLQHKDDTIDIYKHSNLPQMVNTPKRWTRRRMNQINKRNMVWCAQ